MANSHSLDLEASSSQYASISDASQTGLDSDNSFTYECWVKFESLPSSGNRMAFGSKYQATGDNRSWWFVLVNDSGTNKWEMRTCGNGTCSMFTGLQVTASSLSTDTWYHVAMTYNSGTLEVFLDGNSEGTDTGGQTLVNTSAGFSIGSSDSNGSTYLDGLIDDVRYWDDVRTATEINDNLGKELVGNETNLQGYWKLNNDYTDETSNGNDLTASGSPVFSTDVPFGNNLGLFYPDPHPETSSVDGYVRQQYSSGSGQSWSTIRSASGNAHNDDTEDIDVFIHADTTTDNWDDFRRGIVVFDASDLDGFTVDSATLKMYLVSKTDDFSASVSLVSATPASNTDLANGDYDALGTTKLSSDVTIASMSTSSYIDFVLNSAGIAHLQDEIDNNAGIARFGLRITADNDNLEPTWVSGNGSLARFESAENTGTSNDPRLDVEYSASVTFTPKIMIF